ncbi:MAG: response regulator [Pseudanabaena sp.]|jgi:chemosensory pili system protein ChpA (sensor histidine kinase/response regulator)
MNSEQQQQRIMGYFIEEAREHLQIIEQGVLNLQDVLHDSESVNELFRAAHSIKGGSAMLGVVSIQHVSHRLEDFFKILKENPNISVDERLKSLLLAGFDPLSELLDELQGNFKISDELTTETNNRVKPVFAELESYLNQLVADIDPDLSTHRSSQGVASLELDMDEDMDAPDMNAITEQPEQLISSQELIFQQEVTTKMRDMLQLFRGDDSAESRAQLQSICNYFQEIGNSFGMAHWTRFVTQVKNAIVQSSNSYRTLAPILIRELKEAQDLVLADRESEITVSPKIQDLLPYRFTDSFTDNEDDEISTIFTAVSDAPVAIAGSSEISSPVVSIQKVDPDEGLDLFAGQDEVFDLSAVPVDQMDWMDSDYEVNENQHIDGPKVGASELKSLAILFENDDVDFDAAWEDIESNEAQMSAHGSEVQTLDSNDDFADLLSDSSNDQEGANIINPSNAESSIDELFGEFSTDFATEGSLDDSSAIANINNADDSSLFPEDLEDSWTQESDLSFSTNSEVESGINFGIESGIESTNISDFDIANMSLSLDDMIANSDNSNQSFESFDDNLDVSFGVDLGLDLGFDINDQVSNQFSDQSTTDEQFGEVQSNELVSEVQSNELDAIDFGEVSEQPQTIEQFIADDLTQNNFDDLNFDQPNFDDIDFGDTSEVLTNKDLSEIQEDLQEDVDALSSEEYFAELTRQENVIADSVSTDNQFGDDLFSEEVATNEPFALTFSEEEGLGLLEDPFAIDEGLDEVLLEPDAIAMNIPQSIGAEIDDIDIFGDNEALEAFAPITDVPLTIAETNIDSEEDSNFSIFDELGFDNDEPNEELVSSTIEINNNLDESEPDSSINKELNIAVEEDIDSFFTEQTAAAEDLPVIDNHPAFVDGQPEFFAENEQLTNLPQTEDISGNIESFDNFSNVVELENFFEINDESELTTIQSTALNESEPENNLDIFADEVSNVDSLDDYFSDSSEPKIEFNEIVDPSDTFADEANNIDSLDNFFSDSSETEIGAIEIANQSDIFADEVNSIDSLDNFFDGSNISEAEPNQEQSELENFPNQVNNVDDLGGFFTDASENLDEGLGEFLANESTNESSLDSLFTDESFTGDSFTGETEKVLSVEDDLTILENIASDSTSISTSISGFEFDEQRSLTQDDDSSIDSLLDIDNMPDSDPVMDLADMDFTNMLNDLSSIDALVEPSSNSLADIQVNELEEDSLTIDEQLTFIQENANFDDETIETITASNTIDSLADFFQGEDDSEISVLQISQDLSNDNFAVESNSLVGNESIDFSEFDGFGEFGNANEDESDLTSLQSLDDELQNNLHDDLDLLDTLDDLNIQDDMQGFFSESKSLMEDSPIEVESPIEELNGIDDNFDFDDLEAMIGSSTSTQNQLANQFIDSSDRGNKSVETQSGQQITNSQQLLDSDDMNFDELEALLGDSTSFDTSLATATVTSPNSLISKSSTNGTAIDKLPVKPVDDFDDLEGLLRDSFSKDVGPIKTNAPTRTQTTTRKPRLTDSTMRVDVKYLDSLNNLVGELVVNRNLLEEDQERLQQFITNLLHQVQLLSDVSQRMRDQYDRSLLEASLNAGRGRSYSSFDASYNDGSTSNNSASSDFEGIEFDRYNTFHVLSQEIIELIVRVRESASDIEFVVTETDQVTRQLGTITTQVQDDLKQSRMVPFAQIGDRLPRGIRDRALKSGKQAELEIYGRETLIDKAILEQLTDPLTHLVNNAIDHGLEDPATRQKGGKAASGKLTVRAYHQGNQTVISISDDGAGISTDKVKQSAVSKGLRTQEQVNRLNDTEVYALLFEPGFSTAAKADEFKGRGVGLDVVKTCLDEIRGVIIVESVIGKGTTFTIRLPLTLSISKAMFCISDRARVAFPVDGFEDMVEVPQSQIVLNDQGQPCLPWRDTVLPFQHLSNLLSYSRHLSRSSIYGKQENDELCIIILRNDTSYLALQVDQFLGEYEIVIKQLEGPIPQPAGIAGATVLGDGRVMAIANVLELFDIASGRLRPTASGMAIQPIIEEDVAADPTVLIVDDSITVRELLSLTFAKVGYRVEQAKDGQDAWEKLRAGLPCDMIFCDIEMPRMDGLDLLSRLQKDSRLKEIPVAMLTSRGADRHRQSAIQLGAKGYFTKPYLEEELLSASKRLLAGETLPI